jgi:hypothetical protein
MVKPGKAQCEQMFSALTLKADVRWTANDLRRLSMPMPLFPALVVCAVRGDPVGREGLLRCGYADLSIADHAAHPPL